MLKYIIPLIATANIHFSYANFFKPIQNYKEQRVNYSDPSFKHTSFNYQNILNYLKNSKSKLSRTFKQNKQQLKQIYLDKLFDQDGNLENRFNNNNPEFEFNQFRKEIPTLIFLNEFNDFNQLTRTINNRQLLRNKLIQAYEQFEDKLKQAEQTYTSPRAMNVYETRLQNALEVLAATKTYSEANQNQIRSLIKINSGDQNDFDKLSFIIQYGIKPLGHRLAKFNDLQLTRLMLYIPGLQIAESGLETDNNNRVINRVDNDGGIGGLSVYQTPNIARFGYDRTTQEFATEVLSDKKINGKTYRKIIESFKQGKTAFVPISQVVNGGRDLATLEQKLLMGEIQTENKSHFFSAKSFYQNIKDKSIFKKAKKKFEELVKDKYRFKGLEQLLNRDLKSLADSRRLEHEQENPTASANISTFITTDSIIRESKINDNPLNIYLSWNLGVSSAERLNAYVNAFKHYVKGKISKQQLKKKYDRVNGVKQIKIIGNPKSRVNSVIRNYGLRLFHLMDTYIYNLKIRKNKN